MWLTSRPAIAFGWFVNSLWTRIALIPLESPRTLQSLRRPRVTAVCDALIAGVVEDVAYRHGVPVPRWAMEPERSTEDRWWFVTSIPALHPTAFVETPASLANRGVFIRRASLVNV